MKNRFHRVLVVFPSVMIFSAFFISGTIAQTVKSIDLKKVKTDNYLYVIGGNENDVFAGITDNYFVQPDNKLPAAYINMNTEEELNETLKPSSNADILYTFYYDGKIQVLEFGNKPKDNGMYPMNIISYDKTLKPVKTVNSEMKMTSAAFRYDFASMLKNEFSPESGKWRRSYIFSHKVTPDGNKVILMLNNSWQTKPPRTLYFAIFDAGSSTVEQHEVVIPSEETNLLVQDYALSSDGNVYFLAAGFADNSFHKKPGDFKYALYSWDPGTNKLSSVTLDAGDHFVTNLGIVIPEGSEYPVLAGLYTDPGSMKVSGVAYFKMSGPESAKGIFHPLDEKITGKLYEKEEKESDHADEYDIRFLFPGKGGDVTIFAENYARKPGLGLDVKLFGGVSPEARMEDHYGDIVAINISSDGTPSWTSVIGKKQKSTDDNLMFNSFAVAENKGTYGLIFNEEVKNMSDVVWVTIDSNGNSNRKLIFERTKDRLRVAPMLASDDGKGNLFIPAVRFSKTKLVKVSF